MRKLAALITMLVLAIALPLTQPAALADTRASDSPTCTQLLKGNPDWKSGSSYVHIQPVSTESSKIEGKWTIGNSIADFVGYYVPDPTKSCNPFPFKTDYKCLDQCNIGFTVYWPHCTGTVNDPCLESDPSHIGLEYDGTVMTYAGSIQGKKDKENTTIAEATNYKMRLVISTVTQDRENVRNVGISKTTLSPYTPENK